MDANQSLILSLLVVVTFVLAFYGAAVGMIMGQLRLPLLKCVLPAPAAAAASLAISGAGALSGAVSHARGGRVSPKVLLLMGAPSVAGGILGAWLLVSIDPVWANLFIGAFLVYSAIGMLAPANEANPEPGHGPRLLSEVAIGLGLGFLASVTGLMMGSLRLPMMIRYLGLDPRVAVGTNMAVGCLTAVSSSTVLMWHGGHAPFGIVALLAVPTIAGGWLGSKWTGKLDKATLVRMVGWTVALSGVLMLGKGAWDAGSGASMVREREKTVPALRRGYPPRGASAASE